MNDISENFFFNDFIDNLFVDFNFGGNDWNINFSFDLLDNLLIDDLNNGFLSVFNLLYWNFNDLLHNFYHFHWLLNLLHHLLEFRRFGWNNNFDWSINNFVHNLLHNRFDWFLNDFDHFPDSVNVNNFLNFNFLNFDLSSDNWNLLDDFFVDDLLNWNFNGFCHNLDFFCNDWFVNLQNLDSLVRDINSLLYFLDLNLFNWLFSKSLNDDWFVHNNLLDLGISNNFNCLNSLLVNFVFSNNFFVEDNSFEDFVNKLDFLVGNNFLNFLDCLKHANSFVNHCYLFLNLFHFGGNHWDFNFLCHFINRSIHNRNFDVLWHFYDLFRVLFNVLDNF